MSRNAGTRRSDAAMRPGLIDRFWCVSAVLSMLIVGCGGGGSNSQGGGGATTGNPTPIATSLSQPSVNAGSGGFTLTVTGSNFLSTSVVQWNGASRPTSFSSATILTAAIPASDLAFAGSAQVAIANPAPGGGTSSSLPFTINAQIANGVGLSGATASAAVDATSDVLPVGVDDSAVQGGILMSRLDLRFTADATVGQINQALAAVGAGIVSMSKGFRSVTIGIPLQSSVAALQSYIDKLNASPGIVAATLGRDTQTLSVFTATDAASIGNIRHLLPGRFPAAWTVAGISNFGDPAHPQSDAACFDTPIPMVVGDVFAFVAPSAFTGVVPPFTRPGNPATGATTVEHGYDVSTVAMSNAVGANPFPFSGCEPFIPVQLGGHLSMYQVTDQLVAAMPSGKFVLNLSMGFIGDVCTAAPCLPPSDVIMPAFDRAIYALYWKERTSSRWPDFLMTVAGGNERNKESAGIYAGVADARFDAPMNIAELPDQTFGFVSDDTLWTPPAAPASAGFVSLKPSANLLQRLHQEVTNSTAGTAVADNVITVGSTTSPPSSTVLTAHVTPDQLTESAFSDRNPDMLAVGEDVLHLNGTSFSAPQIAGLASYLWMLSPTLRNMPASATRHAILDNTRNKFVDAYASVLSLDPAAAPNGQNLPIRQKLLDANGDQIFNDADILIFLRHFFVVDSDQNITTQAPPPIADFSQYDLNGDGFTTSGSFRERFDLDRTGSTQFGASQYTDVSQTIEGTEIRFDENGVTDLEILCYYAYSNLYQGDNDARKSLLDGRCGLAVQPATATLSPGQVQQFTASLPNGDLVTWSATCGQIDNTGKYTATPGTGTCTVRATDANDPNVSGTATVTLAGGFPGSEFIFSSIAALDDNGNRVVPDQSGASDSTVLPIATPNLNFQVQGDYQHPGNTPVHFQLSAGAQATSIDSTVAPVGVFSGTVACSANGSNSADGNFRPAMPGLSTESAGHLVISLPASRTILFTVGASLTKGTSAGPESRVSGFVEVEYEDLNTGLETNPAIRIDENSPVSASLAVSQPTHGLIISWSIDAGCDQPPTQDGISAARSASFIINYSVTEQ